MTAGLRVVIVDDDPTSLQLLKAILEESGFRVTAAERPSVALQQVRTEAPDLLITDLRMPEMDGLELVQTVRRLRPDLCCLVITGFASDESISDAYGAGATDLLLKPINVAEVQARVRNAAELVTLRRDVAALRGLLRDQREDPLPGPAGPRTHELAELPALPGGGGPLSVGGRDEVLHRLERLGALYRQGILTAGEFEEKKRSLLERM